MRDDRTLYALVSQAYDLKGSPYFRDAVDAIVDWHERRYDRDMWRTKKLVSLLRDSNSNGSWKSGAE